MKFTIDFDDNDNLLLDIRESLFVTLLKAELTENESYLEMYNHKDDKATYKANIKACKTLLKYYTIQEQPEWTS